MRFRGACSNVLNNHALADLHYEAMKLVGPIEFTAEEKAYAQKINDSFAPENARSVFDRMQVPSESKTKVAALVGQPLLGENFPAWDEQHIATGSTDVGDVSWITPLSMLRTACEATGAPGHSWAVTATGATSIGHKGMMHAAKIMAAVAIDLIQRPETLAAARREFEAKTRDEPYKCPIPADVAPPRVPNPERGGR